MDLNVWEYVPFEMILSDDHKIACCDLFIKSYRKNDNTLALLSFIKMKSINSPNILK